jgi:predicted peroxiredoxin
MRSRHFLLFLGVLIVTLSAACLVSQAAPVVRDGVFIHVSHGGGDPHRVVMALSMARMMSADHDVLVYFDIKGIVVVLKSAPDIKYSHFKSSKAQLAALRAKGVLLMACPGCLKAAGKASKDLADGIRIADKDKFFSFTKGRILTLDY